MDFRQPAMSVVVARDVREVLDRQHRQRENNKSTSRKYGLDSFDRIRVRDNDQQHWNRPDLLRPTLERGKRVSRPEYREPEECVKQSESGVTTKHVTPRHAPARNNNEG